MAVTPDSTRIEAQVLDARAALASTLFSAKSEVRKPPASLHPGVHFSAFAAAAAPPSTVPSVNVVGLGISVARAADGSMEPRLQILVKKKFDLSRIPSDHLLPETYGGIAVSVTESGTLMRFADPMTQVRPLQPGISVGPAGISIAGTLGAIVTDGEKNYALSNNHVLANENRAGAGTDIYQPGVLDGGAAADLMARLTVAPNLSFSGSNAVDCALAAIEGMPFTNSLSGEMALNGTLAPSLGMQVFKYGRTTQKTVGRITSVHVEADMTYESGTAHLVQQFAVTCDDGSAFSDAGDSGALIRDITSGSAVGLLVGGSPSQTLVSDITLVFPTLEAALGNASLRFA